MCHPPLACGMATRHILFGESNTNSFAVIDGMLCITSEKCVMEYEMCAQQCGRLTYFGIRA